MTNYDDIKNAFDETLKELKNVGFGAAELKQAWQISSASAARLLPGRQWSDVIADFKELGYGLEDLKDVGFTAKQLKESFTLEQLKDVGFNAMQLKIAEFTAQELNNAGFDAMELKEIYSPEQLKDVPIDSVAPVPGSQDAKFDHITKASKDIRKYG